MDEILKDKSDKITNSEDFGLTKADLKVYNDDLSIKSWDEYPKITISLGEDLQKYQKGIMRVEIKDFSDGINSQSRSYLIQVDALMSIVYSAYAGSLNDLRRATIRQKAYRIWGIVRKLFDKIRK